jgi:hypothetical protein
LARRHPEANGCRGNNNEELNRVRKRQTGAGRTKERRGQR